MDCTWLLPEDCLIPGRLSLAEVQAIAIFCCFGYSQVCWTWSSFSLCRGCLTSLGCAQNLAGSYQAPSPACQGDWLAEFSANTLPYLLYLLTVGQSCLEDVCRTGSSKPAWHTHAAQQALQQHQAGCHGHGASCTVKPSQQLPWCQLIWEWVIAFTTAFPCSREPQHAHLSLADRMLRDFLSFLLSLFFFSN